MKRFLIAAVVLSMLGYASSASALTGTYAGIKGGVNMAELSGDGADGLDMRNGFMGGAFVGGGINEQFGIVLEGLYVQKGAEGSFVVPGDDHAHETVIKLDYLEFPILFTAKFPAGEKMAFSLFAGPTLGFNLSAELEDKDHGDTTDFKDNTESFEFGAAIGGGVSYALSSMSLVLDARYGIGGTSIAKDAGGEAADIKNRGIGIMLGLSFPFGAR